MVEEEESKVLMPEVLVIYTIERHDSLHFVLIICVKHKPFRPSLRRNAPSSEQRSSVKAAGQTSMLISFLNYDVPVESTS